jgi:GNAT superfamily N-acetyltransferase
MRTIELLRLRLEMEFGAPVAGDTLPAALVHADGQPRFIVSKHADGYTRFYRHDVPADVRAELERLPPARAFDDAAAVTAILAAHAPLERTWHVCWYTITTPPPAHAYADAVKARDGFVIECDGLVVARAWTTADSARATEVEVETHPAYRRRGYARQVVAAWAAEAFASGKAVFYSHVSTNAASRGVAHSLGLEWLSDEVEYR